MTREPEYSSELKVELIRASAADTDVLEAMLVSTSKDDQVATMDYDAMSGRIGYLMKNRHGTPFEHNMMTFRVEAPIFVFREWHRHRIGWSYNEMSGRYTQLPAKVYVPRNDRSITQVGKPGSYEFLPGSPSQIHAVADEIRDANIAAFHAYDRLLEQVIANEVARMMLPVNTYSVMYATCNARSLMSFLELRTYEAGSKPMWEIASCAYDMARAWGNLMPITAGHFVDNGWVAP